MTIVRCSIMAGVVHSEMKCILKFQITLNKMYMLQYYAAIIKLKEMFSIFKFFRILNIFT